MWNHQLFKMLSQETIFIAKSIKYHFVCVRIFRALADSMSNFNVFKSFNFIVSCILGVLLVLSWWVEEGMRWSWSWSLQNSASPKMNVSSKSVVQNQDLKNRCTENLPLTSLVQKLITSKSLSFFLLLVLLVCLNLCLI